MSDQPITLYNCKAGDVFEMSTSELAFHGIRTPSVGYWKGVYFPQGQGTFRVVLHLTAYDAERDVYTVECR